MDYQRYRHLLLAVEVFVAVAIFACGLLLVTWFTGHL
jgi:hypothetical protein